MKAIFESRKTVDAYGQIDYCYWRIKELYKIFSKPPSPIDRMIDDVTGYRKKQIDDIKKEIIGLLGTVIKQKKFINADYSVDEELLNQLLKTE